VWRIGVLRPGSDHVHPHRGGRGKIPIERPTRFEMIVNLKTAKAPGLKIPQLLVLRADRAID